MRNCIEFVDVSKFFVRNRQRRLLSGHLQQWFHRAPSDKFYALKNVSCKIRVGESVAVIGSNGAGKSTLLAVVAGLAAPDEGKVTVGGRVAALLELESGFNGDLTGRENVHLNGSLLGLSRKKLDQVFDEIVDFSGVADFIDDPLRTYSSGMLMRLAFAVAVHVNPDILIVDELLAVGDQSFQIKCLEKIRDFQRAGKTLLFVSHATSAVLQFCRRALWLDHGKLIMDGVADEVIAAYSVHSSKPFSQ